LPPADSPDPTAPPHLALVGPTASGKSALALHLARALPGPPVELVSADSMQVYRHLDIGTAKPTPAERAEVPHHLLDLADPGDDFNLAEYRRAADEAIAAIEARGHRALLVGGTGLYVQAVVDRLQPPGRWPEVAAELDAEPDTRALWERLHRLDPVAAARMEPTNRRRVLRALEVTVGSGIPFSQHGPGLDRYPATTRFRMAGVWLPRPVVNERIRQRFQAMLDAGLLDEARRLTHDAAARPGPGPGGQPGPSPGPGWGLGRTAAQALGYHELLEHLAGRLTLDEAAEAATRRTIAFARRQRVWFRRDPRIVWYGAVRNPVDVLPALLGDWSR
jgi:tRNA dimethylallyltransferase